MHGSERRVLRGRVVRNFERQPQTASHANQLSRDRVVLNRYIPPLNSKIQHTSRFRRPQHLLDVCPMRLEKTYRVVNLLSESIEVCVTDMEVGGIARHAIRLQCRAMGCAAFGWLGNAKNTAHCDSRSGAVTPTGSRRVLCRISYQVNARFARLDQHAWRRRRRERVKPND